MSTRKSANDDSYAPEEAQRRFEQTLKGALKTPAKPKEKGRESKLAPKTR